jgi:hypothetical protein
VSRVELEGGRGWAPLTQESFTLEGGWRPLKRFFRLGWRIMAAPTQEPQKKIKNRKQKINKFFIIIILNIK